MDTYYLLGSAVGPHPYPYLVRELQSVIGREARAQIPTRPAGLPDAIVACVGGGSNAIGLFHPFIGDRDVALIGIEAGGRGTGPGRQCGVTGPRADPACLHGSYTHAVCRTRTGRCRKLTRFPPVSTIPPSVRSMRIFQATGRARYETASDEEALAAVRGNAVSSKESCPRSRARMRWRGARRSAAAQSRQPDTDRPLRVAATRTSPRFWRCC